MKFFGSFSAFSFAQRGNGYQINLQCIGYALLIFFSHFVIWNSFLK